jgi:phosphatidylserine/phosphatidylglycerophosphate/cardiolipin synthase-like enzyme
VTRPGAHGTRIATSDGAIAWAAAARRSLRVLACAIALAAAWLPCAHATIIEDAGRVEILFRPGDPVDESIVTAIRAARRQVHVLTFTFTHRGIARALIDAHRRGVEVVVIADQAQALEVPHSALAMLRAAGVHVALDAGPGSAHNKVIVIDAAGTQPVTITGSFNFTVAAQSRNAENVVIFRGSREIAQRYDRYFGERRAGASPFRNE